MQRDFDEVVGDHGFDARFTPVDRLMAGPLSMHLAVADAMNEEDYVYGESDNSPCGSGEEGLGGYDDLDYGCPE